MPRNEQALAILKTRKGGDIALKGVRAEAHLRDLLAEVTVEQRYRNDHKSNIEAVYTFPLPLGAVLLGFEVELAGQKLVGRVVEKKQAERDYEDAVTDGNSAIMLEASGPGLYTVNLGNLMANDEAVIRFRYGLLLSWQGDGLRFLLPTTIAPRYGDALAAGLQPHQVQESALDVEYPLELMVHVEGALASAAMASPTHPVKSQRSETGLTVRLDGKSFLDRDFVLTFEAGGQESSCLVANDGDRRVALASLRVPQAPDSENRALSLKVVIDCSGSMGGVSIAQAKKAAREILDQLRPQDCFNVTLFGTRHTHLFPHMVLATAWHVAEAWSRLEMLDADMGGTEMENALVSTFEIDCRAGEPHVLLITDGQLHEHQKLVARAGKSGHRVFSVGVGTAVAETFLRALADKTGGACELVTPQEGMAERVLMQFHRMRQPRLSKFDVRWPATPEWTTPLPETVFAGDTIHVFAGFNGEIAGEVSLGIGPLPGIGRIVVPLTVSVEPEIPRMAAANRLDSLSVEQATALALEFQLLSRSTNYLIVAERDAKADDLPELQQVPQMLAAGWGGTADLYTACSPGRSGSAPVSHVAQCVDSYDIPAFLRRQDVPSRNSQDSSADQVFFRSSLPRESKLQRIRDIGTTVLRKLGLPTRPEKLLTHTDVDSSIAPPISPAEFVAAVSDRIVAGGPNADLPRTIDFLAECGLDEDIVSDLRTLVAAGDTEASIVTAFLHRLSESPLSAFFDRGVKRLILKFWKRETSGSELDATVNRSLAFLEAGSWNWQSLMPDMATHS